MDRNNVYCSPYFVIFKESPATSMVKRVCLSYWPYFYKRGYKPSVSEIVYAFNKQFPDENIDWASAIDQSDSDSLFHEEYHIPVSFIKMYERKSDRPDFDNQESKIAWLKMQKDAMDQVQRTGIPFDKFHWQIHKVIHRTENGKHQPAIKAIGMSTVLNVLKEV